ncbi:DinB family protein [Chitinophaga sp. 212800010-3]|uniref:DinB family protein n=1 Tax=unclassified Chitinophaga TaxID=2619133 RepID=UPI002DE37657|nr:DinB family protein [Chitinophaga sp. 212800010-3]
MKKEAIHPDSGYYNRYISQVPDVDLNTALDQSLAALQSLDIAALEPLSDYAYAPGKWTVKMVLQHIVDTERVFSFRAMLFSRHDRQLPPSMDENEYAANAPVEHRQIKEILDELKALRMATIAQYNSFTPAILLTTGMSWKTEMSVLAMGFTIVGHQIHHLNILQERYLQPYTNKDVSI